MSADSPGPSPSHPERPSWRAKAASPGGPRAAGRKRFGWAEKRDTQYEQAALRHRFRIAAWSLLFLALVAGFIVWLAWKPLRTPVLLAVVTDCEFPLPPNAWAREDAERLQTLDREEVLKCATVPWESKESGVAELRRQLAATQPGGPHKDLVVLYLSMPGAIDGQAEPCLIPPGASPWQNDQWLRVRDLLGQLFPKDRTTKPASVKTLLILDATRMGANWNLGLPYNSFAERLQAVLEELSIPNLYVLNSTGPGQIGWAAPELKGSVFGYFLWQGLNGAADVEPSGNRDKVITLQELLRYLKAYVGQWVMENRADVQEPMLLPADADFPIVFRHSSQPTTVPAPGDADPRWQPIAALWEKHAELRPKAPHRFQPVAWEEFQQKLLRLEQLVEAGAAYDAEFNDTRKQAESLAAAFERDPIGGDVAAYSFPLLRQFGGWPSAAELAAVPAPWKKPPAAAAKPEEKEKPDAAAKPGEKPDKAAKPEEKPAADQPYSYRAASAAAWEWLLADPSHVGDLPAALKFLDAAAERPAHEPIEIHFLRMLAEHLDRPLQEAGGDHVHRALLARNLAEQAAAPADERTLYWLQPPLATADQSRRDAEDRLFVGSPEALAEADVLWTSAAGENGRGGAYAAAIHRSGEIAAAFQLRDRAWAEIPYLAQWILARQQNAKSADAQLRLAIDATRTLSLRLDEHLADAEWPPDVAAAATRLDSALRILDGTFQAECAELKTAGEDKQTLQRIGAVLAVPLLDGRDRNRLRDEYLSIVRKIAPTGTEYEVGGKERAAAEKVDVAAQALGRLSAWDELPMALILDNGRSPDAPPGEEGSRAETGAGDHAQLNRELQLVRLARQGADLRRRLDGLPELAQADLQATANLLEQKAWQPAGAVRAGDSKADRLSREATAFLDGRLRAKLGVDPAEPLRRLDLHYLMLWQGNRTADDFWGPATGQQEPYFASVAHAYGESAEKLRKAVPRWEAAVGQLVEAAHQGVQPAVEPKNVFVDRNDPAVRHAFSVAVPEHTPKGTAAVYVQDSAGLLPLLSQSQTPLRRMGVAVTAPGTWPTPTYWISNDARLQRDDRLQAVALYRGQVRGDDFYVPPAAGLDIVYTRPDYPRPTVVVRGELKQTSAVMFIFDCSGSMGARMVIEGKETTRLNVARDTLQAILRRLAGPQNPFDVGLIAYGHRVGWDPGDTSKMVIRDPRDPHAFRFVPRPPEMATINPSNDVELMLPLGRFGQEDLNDVSRKVALLENMGETPLYLSIIEAIHNLRGEAAAGQRRVVVITDGVNNQTGGGPDIKYREDVEQEFKKPGNEDIRLDVVGFNIEQQEAGLSREETARRLSDLKDLARAHGGAFHDTSDPTTLLRALQRSLALSEYVVETLPGGRRVTPQPLELNAPCVLDRPPATGADYRVRLIDPDHSADARVTVEGGEALELFAAKTGSQGECRLIYHRYAKGLRDAVDKIPAPEDEQKRSFYVGAHLPEWKGAAARFFVSVQNADAEQFSPRPQEAWIEIRPIGLGNPNGVKEYCFYDMDVLPDCPVPVLTCVAPNWPQSAKEAEIQLWCKLHKTSPDRVLTIGEFRRDKPVLEAAPGVTFEMDTAGGQRSDDPLQVIVVERHPADSELYLVKIEMQPPPERVVHRYNVSTGVIRHTFFYENAAKSEVENYRVLLTARRKLVDGAIALPRPLRVTVPVD